MDQNADCIARIYGLAHFAVYAIRIIANNEWATQDLAFSHRAMRAYVRIADTELYDVTMG